MHEMIRMSFRQAIVNKLAREIYTSVMQAACGLINQQTQCWQEAKQTEVAYCA
jgi:hypothetical protein